jgi:dipeptidyl aminopeptidase/acylaminoacyl peptidase
MLKGFGVGEEGVRDVLTPTQVTNRNTTNDGCIGCHTSVPGGDSVQFVFGPPTPLINMDTYFNNVSDIQMGTAGTLPAYVTPDALALLQTLRGIPAFSRSHWADGDRIVLLTDANNQGNLYWVQLDTPAPVMQGTLARTGDPGGATEPAFSHDGTRIVYVSSSNTDGISIHDGRLDSGPADLYMIPYNNRAGGAATKLGGAADPAFTEYYPAFSPNDDLVAFTRVAGPTTPSSRFTYGNSNSEIFVVQTTGGAAIRLAANDSPACVNKGSPGQKNDWSKWSPEATTAANGKTYNWLTFSTVRRGNPQLFITAIVTQPGMAPQTFPALYLWNQPATDSNHTPSWDNFKIPPVTIVP